MANPLKIEQFIKLIYNLLPQGRAWNNDPDSNLFNLISTFANEFCRDDDRLDDLLREIDPFQTNELLPDWESMLGLPGACLENLPLSDADRRRLIIQTLNALGGASALYFEQILANAGYVVEVTPFFRPFWSGIARSGDPLTNGETYFVSGGAKSGDRLYNSGWTHWWEVHSDDDIVTCFRSGQSRSGDRLCIYGNERIECIIRKLKPAHTGVLFTYGL